MTTVIEGRLEYLGWDRPWAVSTDNRAADLSTPFWEVACRLKDKPAAMKVERDRFSLLADLTSYLRLEFDEVGSGIILFAQPPAFGFSNVLSYCETILCNLNGREVIASIEDEEFHVFANPQAPEVPALWRKREPVSNSIPIEDEFVRSHCKPGTADCCLFLTAGAGGFECAKFAQGLTRTLLNRKAEGTIRAQRIGDCRCAGWEGNQ